MKKLTWGKKQIRLEIITKLIAPKNAKFSVKDLVKNDNGLQEILFLGGKFELHVKCFFLVPKSSHGKTVDKNKTRHEKYHYIP